MTTRANILVVDDNRTILSATRRVLEAAGYETLGAKDGEEALQAVRAHNPDLMLLDVNMPKMNGFEVCRRIKADSSLAGTFIIIMSSERADNDSYVDGLNMGADDYIVRPIANRELLARVRAMLRIQSAEKALRQSEQRYKLLLDSVTDYIYTVQVEDGRSISTIHGRGCAAVTGYAPEDYQADAGLWYRMIYESDRAVVMEQAARILAGQAVSPLEHRILHRDGSMRWVRNTPVPHYNLQRHLIAYDGLIVDITERKMAEDALRESEERLRQIASTLHEVFWLRDTRTLEVLYVNPAYETIWGRPCESLYENPTSFVEAVHPDDKERVMKAIAVQREKGTSFNEEYRIIRPDGSVRWVWGRTFPITNEAGEVYRIAASVEDFTERKQAEEYVKKSEEQYRILFENNPLPMWVYDLKTLCFLAVNDAAVLKYGYTKEEFLSMTIKEIRPAEDMPVLLQNVTEVLDVLQDTSPWRHRTKDGNIIFVEIVSHSIEYFGRQARLVMANDITERKRAEEQLLASEENYRSLFENIPDGLYRTTLDGKFLAANPAFMNMFGLESEAELKKVTAYDLYIDPGERNDFIDQAQTHHEVHNMEVRLRRIDGQLFYGLDNARAFCDKAGTILYIGGTLTDITARKRAEEALRASEERLRFALEGARDGLWDVQMETGEVYMSPRGCEILGYQSEEMAEIARVWSDLVCPDDMPRTQEQLTAYFEGWAPLFEVEQRLRTKSGGWKWVLTRGKAVERDATGKLLRMTGTHTDIADRKQAEELLQRRMAELEVLYDNSLTITRLLDPHQIAQTMTEILSQKLEWHHAAVRLYHPESNSIEFLALHEPHADSETLTGEIERLQQTIQVGQGLSGWVIQHGEAVCSGDVGADPRYVETYPGIRSGVYVPMKLGESVLGCIVVESTQPAAFDEQDQRLLSTMAAQAAIAIHQAQLYGQVQQYAAELEKRVEERTADLQHANLELARAARMKDEFLASMSHELRTPLTGILGLSESLQLNIYGELNEKQIKVLKNIENSGRHLLELINDILDLSKIEAGKFDLQIEPCSLSGVCQASLQMTKGMAQQKHQHTSFAIAPDSIILRADARRLKQMLVNLLGNAVKFTPDGGSLGIEVRGSEREQRVRITVWDTGIGIRPEDLPRLFQPFVQLDSSLSRQYAGTGLGLSLVQRMTSLHGGSVEVESVPGRGSRFTIVLPWETEAAQPVALTDKIASRLHRALTIDDNEINAELLTRYLEKLGVKNRIQPAGLGAVELAAQTAPDVILIRFHLPDKPGLELLAELKSDERTRNIPIILMSVEEKRGEAMALGAAGYLVKPFSLADLQTELQRVAALMSDLEPGSQAVPVVLLADDNEIILEAIADFLRTRGFQVIAVHSGNELLERIGETHLDILLIDIQMAGVDGLDVIRRIRAHPDAHISTLPMIAVTALAMSGDRERCMAAGANEYLSKPLHLENLVETIRELCKE